MAKKKKYVTAETPEQLAKVLGLPASAAMEWRLRMQLSEQIIRTIAEDNLSITEVARNAGTSRARVTTIVKRNAIGISLDVLVRVLGAIGQKIEVRFSKAS